MNIRRVDKTDEICESETTMHSNEYLQSLAKTIELAQKDIAVLNEQRADLQKQLAEKEKEILRRQQDVENFVAIWKSSPLGDKPMGDIAPLTKVTGLSDAVAYVLRVAKRRMVPTEIRDRLEQWGYDTKKYDTSLVSTLHTVLTRFDAKGWVKVHPEGHRRKSYEWIKKPDEHQEDLMPETKTPKRG